MTAKSIILNLLLACFLLLAGMGGAAAAVVSPPLEASNPAFTDVTSSDQGVTYNHADLLGGQTPTAATQRIRIETSVSQVPLPAALPMFVSALAVLGVILWRRRRRRV